MRRSSAVLLVVATACAVDLDDRPVRACDDAHPCRADRACVDGLCIEPADDDAGSDAGEEATHDAGSDGGAARWQQRLHGFGGTTVDTGCSVNIDPSRGNRVVATVGSPVNGNRDSATADVTEPAQLPRGDRGRLYGHLTVPPSSALAGPLTFASLVTDAGLAWVRLGLTADGALLVVSDPGTVSEGELTQTLLQDAGSLAGDHAFEVTWARPGQRQVWLDGELLAGTLVTGAGTSGPPTALHLGIDRYRADAGLTLQLEGWQLGEDPDVPLGAP